MSNTNSKRNINLRGLTLTIMAMSILQMSTNAISSILAAIAGTFPDASVTQVQFLMSFPFFFVVTVSLIVGFLGERLNKKITAAAGLALGGISGLGAFFMHGSLTVLYVWSALLGIGIGLVVPICTSLIAIYYDGTARDNMYGYQSSASNLGSIIMTFLGGLLASIAWHMTYLVYLLVIPGLLLTLKFVPGKEMKPAGPAGRASGSEEGRLTPGVFLFCGIAMLHMLLFFIGPTNIAMLVAERGIGSEMEAGTATSLILVTGMLGGLVFGRLAARIGKHTITLGYVLLAIGFVIINNAHSMLPLYIGALIAGLSNAWIMPQCMGSAVRLAPAKATLVNSLFFSMANIGTFLAPLLTGLAGAISKSNAVGPRFALAATLSAIGACVFAVVFGRKKE